jgi:hypothetical protein
VTLRRRGYSGSIDRLAFQTFDKILTPGEGFGICLVIPTLRIKVEPSELALAAISHARPEGNGSSSNSLARLSNDRSRSASYLPAAPKGVGQGKGSREIPVCR